MTFIVSTIGMVVLLLFVGVSELRHRRLTRELRGQIESDLPEIAEVARRRHVKMRGRPPTEMNLPLVNGNKK